MYPATGHRPSSYSTKRQPITRLKQQPVETGSYIKHFKSFLIPPLTCPDQPRQHTMDPGTMQEEARHPAWLMAVWASTVTTNTQISTISHAVTCGTGFIFGRLRTSVTCGTADGGYLSMSAPSRNLVSATCLLVHKCPSVTWCSHLSFQPACGVCGVDMAGEGYKRIQPAHTRHGVTTVYM